MFVGQIIKEIRINKKIQANFLYKKILSRPAIVKFEKGESDTTIERFFIILDRLNISLEEFEVIYKKEENKDMFYVFNYINSFYKRDLKTLNILSHKSYEEYLITGNRKYLHYKAVINLLIADINGVDGNEDDISTLKTYLLNCDTWGYYELTLFTNTLSFYSNDLIDLVYEKSKKHLIGYNNLLRYKNELSLLLFNILEQKIKSRDYFLINKYLHELNNLKDYTEGHMYFQAMHLYFSELIRYINYKTNSIDSITSVINCFKVLNMDLKVKQCQNLLEFVIENRLK